MRKIALVLLLAIFIPSLGLAWLAMRSLQDQQLVIERQQFLLAQGFADGMAGEIAARVEEEQREFRSEVESLMGAKSPSSIVSSFDEQLRKAWPLCRVGFVVSLDGKVLAPMMWDRPDARKFLLENEKFLSSRESVEVYWNSPKGAINLTQLDRGKSQAPEPSQPGQKMLESNLATKNQARQVIPQQQLPPQKSQASDDTQALSKLATSEAEFRQLVGDGQEGSLARFLQDKLNLLFWYRPPRNPQLVFGSQVDIPRLTEQLRDLIHVPSPLDEQIAAALVDDSGRAVAVFPAEARMNWKRPFVATEVGEALPHWEIAVCLLDPARSQRTAATLRTTLGLLIFFLIAAIATGSGLIAADLRRQLVIARQKTDFVSNVSHELKTPLTSIRMFSELLSEGRVKDPAKQQTYLGIISLETARLTRLINNVLDFARLDRGEMKYQYQACDIIGLVRDTVQAYEPQLISAGFTVKLRAPDEPGVIACDKDAISQVLVNLLSNAEKYSTDRKEIEVHAELTSDGGIDIKVLDRGSGVSRGLEEKIFEQFFRANDSLASGIQGSGLGLTLARQIARAHNGDLTYAPREDGGSCFTLHLPSKPITADE